jgi:hypothetical protein
MVRAIAELMLFAFIASLPSQTSVGDTAPVNATATDRPAMLPDRLLDCTLRRITNFDPNRNQGPGDFTFEGRHRFKLFLPAIPVRTTEPPASTSPPEPVDPRTRIVADPDGLAREAPIRFDRVVDYWPDRVEMTAPISNVAVKLIIVTPIDLQRKTADLFMANANDAVTWDHDRLYSGSCSVVAGPAAVRAAA